MCFACVKAQMVKEAGQDNAHNIFERVTTLQLCAFDARLQCPILTCFFGKQASAKLASVLSPSNVGPLNLVFVLVLVPFLGNLFNSNIATHDSDQM